jgi:signal transduction histidine kinase
MAEENRIVLSEHSPKQALIYLGVMALVLSLLAGVYPLLVNSTYRGSADIHSAVEMVGALFGLIAGISMTAHFYALGNRFYLLVGLAYFVNGAEDFAHGLICFHNIFGIPPAALAMAIPATYVTGRILMGLLLFAAPFATAWFGESRHPKRETRWTSAAVITFSIALTTLAFHLSLPRFVRPEAAIPRPVDFLSAVLLSASFVVFLMKYYRERNALTWWILLSIGVNVIGQVMMSFSRAFYDSFFDIAHVYKIFGYMIPLLGFALYQIAIITDRRRAEEELKTAYDKLKHTRDQLVQSEKLAAVGQLAAGVAHEINNPLGVILGFAQGMVRRLRAGDPLETPLKSIEREAVRCKLLVQNLLTFSRVEKGGKDLVDLNKAITETFSVVLAQSRVQNAEVIKEFSALPDVNINVGQIRQLIMNLADNAIDAMPGGGKLTVRTRPASIKGGEAVEIQVEDTGHGIPEEIRARIFDPFFTTKEAGKGTGLGLSLVYEIVQKHGGTITVQSEIGKGTLFSVLLPIEP